jgi:dihydroorotate dehydrogenase electron transfer subunit
MVLLYGARTASEVPPEGHFRQYFARVRVTTDDGTKGRKGFVTDLLMDELSQGSGLILACGPRPMLAETARLALAAGAPCQVSLEARMACGLGACLGCVVPAAGSDRAYLRVCAEGPVFSAGEVSWPEWT